VRRARPRCATPRRSWPLCRSCRGRPRPRPRGLDRYEGRSSLSHCPRSPILMSMATCLETLRLPIVRRSRGLRGNCTPTAGKRWERRSRCDVPILEGHRRYAATPVRRPSQPRPIQQHGRSQLPPPGLVRIHVLSPASARRADLPESVSFVHEQEAVAILTRYSPAQRSEG
jgi:hypothetical protein